MYTATLRCGSVLTYEVRSFVPAKGESVPCRRHGYCVVVDRGRAQSSRTRPRDVVRARPREQRELLAWLEGCPGATVRELRRQRFTLRLIWAAERDGLVAVDPRSGTVALTCCRRREHGTGRLPRPAGVAVDDITTGDALAARRFAAQNGRKRAG